MTLVYAGPPRGEDHKNRKLSEQDVREMRRLHAMGYGYGRIAHEFGVSRAAAHRAVAGISWRHVS